MSLLKETFLELLLYFIHCSVKLKLGLGSLHQKHLIFIVFFLQDKLLDSYMRTGSFTKENDLPDYPSRPMPRRPYSLINMLLWASFVLSQILRFYYNLIVSGSLLSLSFAVGIVIFGKYLNFTIHCAFQFVIML